MKRPSFQFYPGDWQANSNLRRCTHAEKGAWMDVLCLLHDQVEYGVLRWTLKEIVQASGAPAALIKGLVAKGVLKGDDVKLIEPFVYVPRSGRKNGAPVTLVPVQDGPIWYSSRMVRDEYVRTIRGEATRFDGDKDASSKSSPKPPFGDGPSTSSSSPSSPSVRDIQSTTTTETIPDTARATSDSPGGGNGKPSNADLIKSAEPDLLEQARTLRDALEKRLNLGTPIITAPLVGWLKAGATPELINATIDDVLASKPGFKPSTIAYFGPAMDRAINAKQHPAQESKTAKFDPVAFIKSQGGKAA